MKTCLHETCKYPVFGKGYCKIHQWKRTDNKLKPIRRTALKRGTFKPKEYDGNINLWFDTVHSSLTGVCSHCGGKSCKGDPTYWKFSIAHILEKSHFPSVATHPSNFLELCHFGSSCHANYDNKMLGLMDLNCFNEVIDKFCKMYPSIAPAERRRIPSVLMQYVEVEL